MKGYVAITEGKMRDMVESTMGFKEIEVPGTKELVFQRAINDRYAVRILSSVVGGATRDTGEDAIRVAVYDMLNNKMVKVERRVNRTQNALTNMRERAREVWSWVKTCSCPDCGSVMVERKGARGKFLGCSGYPACKTVRNIP